MGAGRVPFEELDYTFKSTGNPRLIYIGTDQQAYELDDGQWPTSARESEILRALLRVSKPTEALASVKPV